MLSVLRGRRNAKFGNVNLSRRSRQKIGRVVAAAMEPMETRVLMSASLGTSQSGVLDYDVSQGHVAPAFSGGLNAANNVAPSFSSVALTTFTTGTPGTFPITTSGTPNAALTETGTLPGGVSFVDNGTGTATLAGTPSTSTGGVYDFSVTANNGITPNAQQSFVLTVDQAPAFTSTSSETFQTGFTQTYIVISTGYPSPTVTETGTLPTGVTFTPEAHGFGVLSGAPAVGTGGIYDVTLTTDNGVGTAGTQAFVFTVLDAPVISSPASTSFYAGQASTFSVTTSGYPNNVLTETGALPTGVSFVDNGNGTATLAGTPTTGSTAVYDLTISAANGVGNATTQSFVLTVGAAPAFTSTDAATFTTGTTASFTISTTGFPDSALNETGSLPSGLTFVDNGNNTATLYGTPGASAGGTYDLTLGATNGFTPNASQSFTLTVDQAPAVTSGNTYSFIVSTTGSFTVMTTGFPTSTLSEVGDLPPGVTFTDNSDDTATLTGTPNAGSSGEYDVTIDASNGVGTMAAQSFKVFVDQAPAITSANNATFVTGTSSSFTMTTTGYPDSSLSETGSLPSGLTFVDNGNNTATLYGTPASGTGTTYNLTLHAGNGVGSNASQPFTLTVDQAPAITSTNHYVFTTSMNGSFTVQTTGFPLSTLSETGSLPTGLSFVDNSNDTATISGTPGAATGGNYSISLGATNGIGSNASQPFTLTVDQAPAITSANAQTFTAGSPGLFIVATTGYPAPALTETGSIPANLSFVDLGNGTADLIGNLLAGSGGVYNLTIHANNGVGSVANQSYTLTVYGEATLPTTGSTDFQVGSSSNYPITAGGYPSPFFTETGALPTGVTLVDNGNGTAEFLGTPATGTQGNYSITINANNYIGSVAAETFSLQVGLNPSFTSAAGDTFTTGSPGSFSVTTTAFPNPVISESGTLPAGVSFTDNGTGTATFMGTPSAGTGGTYAFTLTASNGYSPAATQSFVMTVDQAPAFTSGTTYTFITSTTGGFTVTTTGYPFSTLSESGSLPPGITFVDNGNNTATIAGVTTPGNDGVFDLTLTSDNGVGTAGTQTFVLTVDQPPAITSGSSTTYTTGNFGTFTVTDTGFPAPTLTETGALPSGVTFVNGVLSGTPGASAGGVYDINVIANNNVGTTASQAFVLTVDQAPAITSASISTFTVGTNGTFSVVMTGYPAPTVSTVSSLPTGVTLSSSGLLSGDPAALTGGVYVLSLDATNGIGSDAMQSFTLTVDEAPTITSGASTTFTTGSPGTFAVTTTGYPAPSFMLSGATLPSGVSFVDNANGTATLAGTPGASTGGTYGLTFTASNGVGTASVENFALTIDQAPSITSTGTATFTVGSSSTFTISSTGYPIPAVTTVTSLPSGLTFVSNANGSATIYGTPAAATGGAYTIALSGANGVGSNASQNLDLVIDQAPAITSSNGYAFTTSLTGTFTVTTTGYPTSALSLTGSLPAGVTFVDNGNDTATLSGTPGAVSGGDYSVTVGATNSIGTAASQAFNLIVDQAPAINSLNNATFVTGASYSFLVTTTGYPLPAITENSGSLPSGLTFHDNGNGTASIYGTAATGSYGTYNLGIGAGNGIGSAGTQSFTLTVDQAPSYTTANNTTFTVGQTGTFAVTVTGLPTAALSESGSLPTGVTFVDNANDTATLSGTPGAGTGGAYTLSFTANNGVTPVGTQSFVLYIDQQPAFTSPATQTFQVGSPLSYFITTSGYPAPPIVEAGSLPSGISFHDFGNGTAEFTGTPIGGSGGIYDLTLTANNGIGTAGTQSFVLNVNQSPTFMSTTSTTFVAGSPDTFAVTVQGYPALTLTETGSLPSGVTFVDNGNGTATLAGTPTSGLGATYGITFNATNIIGTSSQAFVLTVGQIPSITSATSTTFVTGSTGSFTVTSSGYPSATYTESGTLPTGVAFNNSTGILSGTPAAGTGGNYPLTFTGTNTFGMSTGQSFTLTVDQAPAFTSAANTTFVVGSTGSFTFTGTGFPAATFSETGALPNGVTFVSGVLSGDPTTGTGGVYDITVTTDNGVAPAGTQSFALTVNEAPTITSATSATFVVGSTGSFALTASGYPASIFSTVSSLPSGLTLTNGILSGTPVGNIGGSYPISFTANNGVSPNGSQNFTVIVDQAPAFTSAGTTTFVVGSTGSFTYTATGYPAPTFSETGALPNGVTFVSGVLSGDPTTGTGGVYDITVTTDNGVAPAGTQSFVLTVNEAPTITNASSATFVVGSTGSFALTASGYPASIFSTVSSLPSGVTLTNGVLSGTPVGNIGGSFPITFTANNGVSPNGSQSFTLIVDQAPAFTSAGTTTFVVGSTGSFTFTGTGFPAATFSESGALPNGVTFVSGVLSGDPTAGMGGVYDITVTTDNGVAPAGTQGFVLTVNEAPTITSANSATFVVGSTGSFALTASGYPASIFSTVSSLPSGLTLTNGILSGTPVGNIGDTYSISFTANNGVSPNGSQSFTLIVDQAPAFTSAGSTTFTVGSTGSFTYTATGYPAPTFSESGELPNGVTFVNGVLSGDPTAGTGSVYDVTVTTDNGIAPAGTQSFVLTVDEAPSIISAGSATFTVGATGSFALSASGFPASTFSTVSSLPSGLTLTNGVLSGTPTGNVGGTYSIAFTANNGVTPNGTQTFMLTVDQAPAFTSAGGTTFTVGTNSSFTFTSNGFPAPTISELGSLPSGLTFNDGVLSGDPATGTGNVYAIIVTTDNGIAPAGTQAFVLTIDEAPTFTSAGSATFVVGSTGSFTLSSNGFPASTFSTSGTLPSGLTLTNGVLSGTPVGNIGGAYVLSLTASNGVSPNGSQSLTVFVDQSPAITSAGTTTFTVGSTGSFTVTDTGFPAPGVTESGALPGGVTFTNGVLSGTPNPGTGGTYNLILHANNNVGSTAGQAFVLTVDQSPSFISAASTIFTVGTSGAFPISTGGFPAATVSTVTTLPSGLTLTNGTLSGIPGSNTGGTYVIALTASNGVLPNAPQSFTLTIDQAPAITSGNTATFTVGSTGSFSVIATGFPADSINESGTLPNGVTFSNGVLSGTPAAGTGGIYDIAFGASNGVGSNATQPFVLTVDQAPAITSGATATFVIGSTGSFTVTASGVPVPTINESGTLPAGLSFSANVLSGTPQAGSSGVYDIAFGATNGIGSNATESFVITVDQVPAITSAASATFTAGSTGSFTVHSTGFPTTVLAEHGALPTGVTFLNNNDGTATITGVPVDSSGGTYSFSITGSNGAGSGVTQAFTLTVNSPQPIATLTQGSNIVVSYPDGTPINVITPYPSGKSTVDSIAVAKINGVLEVITGTGAGSENRIKTFNALTGAAIANFVPFASTFTGGVTVATGDVNDDGTPDIIAGQGAGSVDRVRVFDGNTLNQIGNFVPYAGYTGGVNVAAADENNDGFADVITVQNGGVRPLIEIFNGQSILNGTATLLSSYNPFGAGYNGPVAIAVGDVNDDGTADIIAAKSLNGGSAVRVFSGASNALIQSFPAFAPSFTGALNITSEDVNGDGHADIIVSEIAPSNPLVSIFSGVDDSVLFDFTITGVSSPRQ